MKPSYVPFDKRHPNKSDLATALLCQNLLAGRPLSQGMGQFVEKVDD